MEGRDFDEENPDHERHHHLEFGRNVVGKEARGVDSTRPPLTKPHAGQHRLNVEILARSLKGNIACGKPHVPVSGLLIPPGLIPPVCLEQPSAQMVDRCTADVFDEVALHVLRLQQADVGAIPLDRADAGQCGHEGFGNPGPNEEARLFDIGERSLPTLEGHVDQLGRETGAVLLTPRLDRRRTEPVRGET